MSKEMTATVEHTYTRTSHMLTYEDGMRFIIKEGYNPSSGETDIDEILEEVNQDKFQPIKRYGEQWNTIAADFEKNRDN